MRLITWIAGVPVAAVAVAFAVSNRASVTFDLWPLPWSVGVPLYLAVLVPLAVGLVGGMALAWAAGGQRRARMRERGVRLAELEQEAASLRSRVATAEPA